MFILEPNDGGLATLERGSKLAMQGAQSIADMRKEYRVRKQAQEMAKALGKPEMATLYELAMLQKPEEFFSNFSQRQLDQQFLDLVRGKQPQGAPNQMLNDLAAPDAIPNDILSQNFSPDGSPMEGAEMPMPPSEEALDETVNAFKGAQGANGQGAPQSQPQGGSTGLNSLSDEQLAIMSAMKGNYGDFARGELQRRQAARKEERRAFEADRAFEQKQKKLDQELQKEPKEYFKGLREKYESAMPRESLLKLMAQGSYDRMPLSSLRASLSEKTGVPPGVLLTAPEQVMQKLSQQLIRAVGSDFAGAGRILQSMMENEMKSNPSLFNSEEGMRRLALIGLVQDELAKKKYEIAKDIVKDNKGKYPEDLDQQVIERFAPYVEKSTYEMGRILSGDYKNKALKKATEKGQQPPKDLVAALVKKHGKNPDAIKKEIEALGYAY